MARELKEKYRKNLIIPMTIYKENNFKYIVEGLEEIDKGFYHFYLNGTYSTIQSRLIKRGDRMGVWTFKRIELYLGLVKQLICKAYILMKKTKKK